ncbi:MAG: C45 family autoproteolytic acyltransferase/hydrolase [Methanobacterium sp. ERen5]|nr:MAG: C45 family autoproteolytic acyltransferase/hydrolase [Methanobacterium sp. ERen5]
MVVDGSKREFEIISEEGKGRLFETAGFLIPVLSGSNWEMGYQYGSIMEESMQKAYDVLVEYAYKSGYLSDEDAKLWAERAFSTFSNRNRKFYEGLMESTGWSLVKIGILDQVIEYGLYTKGLHASIGCTSIFSWETSSNDDNMYIGRNMDWVSSFNKFPQVLMVTNPDDGSYRSASVTWPGMFAPYTILNEHGLYLDVHDGASMGGSVVIKDRPPIAGGLFDIMSETSTLKALIQRIQGVNTSTSIILNLADKSNAVSMECSSLAGNRIRYPEGDSLVSVNTFLNPDWGIHIRNTVSHSLERLSNMNDRLAENRGKIDAEKTRELMDIPLFEEDGTIGRGCTKPTKVDVDQTTHQIVTDITRREFWLKIPNPDSFADWTHINLKELWEK